MKQKDTKAAIKVLLVTIALLLVASPYPVQAENSGPNFPLLGINLSGVGTETWISPENIYVGDGAYAEVSLNQSGVSNNLQGTDFQFNIPADATISGIQVTVDRYSSKGSSPRVVDYIVSLVKGGTITAENKADTGTNWPTSSAPANYGGPSDLWNNTWTPSDINNSNFGVVIAVQNTNVDPRTAYIDYLSITVTYKRQSSTSVNCGAGMPVVDMGVSITCQATVTAVSGPNTPSGTVSWGTDATGAFTPLTCTLAGSGGSGACTVSYLPGAIGDGSHLITATYAGDSNFTGSSGSQTVEVNENLQHIPVITSNGGGAAASIQVAENTTAVTSVTAAGASGGVLAYSIVGGPDAARFSITSSGALSFSSAPNYEAPTDAGTNNVYEVTVQVADSLSLTDYQSISVTVTDANDAPSITEIGEQTVTMSEDSSPTPFTLNLNATDLEIGDTLSWSILSPAVNGTALASGAGNSMAISYAPNANYIGPDQFTVKVADSSGLFDTLLVNVAVTPVVDYYYVDNTQPDASDSNPGTDPALPLLTINRGAVKAEAGDTVFVLAGSYPETVMLDSKSGIPGYPITFQASAGVTVSGNGNLTSGSAFYFATRSYIVVDGFNIVDTAYKGISAFFSDHLTISNNHISGAGSNVTGAHQQGIYLYSTTDTLITHNITNDNSCIGIRLTNSSNNNTLSNNVSFGNYSPPGGTQDAAGIELDDSDSNLIIHNITYGNEDSGINLYKTAGDGSNNNKVIGNLTFGNGDHGIDNNSSSGNTMVGNTVHGNYTSGINLELNSGGAILENNILMNNGINPVEGKFGDLYVDSTSVGGTTLDYNLYYRTGGIYLIRWDSVSYLTLAAFRVAFPALEVHGLEANPLFVNPAPRVDARPAVPIWGDYRLLPLSPAIDSADSAAPFHPNVDIAGLARFNDPDVANTGAGPRKYDDRGAYEKQSGASTADNVVFLPLLMK